MDSDIDSCHSNSTSTPNSSTPSTPTSETTHGVSNGYATIRGKPLKFNLHTISENLGQLFSKQGSKHQSDSLDGEAIVSHPLEYTTEDLKTQVKLNW